MLRDTKQGGKNKHTLVCDSMSFGSESSFDADEYSKNIILKNAQKFNDPDDFDFDGLSERDDIKEIDDCFSNSEGRKVGQIPQLKEKSSFYNSRPLSKQPSYSDVSEVPTVMIGKEGKFVRREKPSSGLYLNPNTNKRASKGSIPDMNFGSERYRRGSIKLGKRKEENITPQM